MLMSNVRLEDLTPELWALIRAVVLRAMIADHTYSAEDRKKLSAAIDDLEEVVNYKESRKSA